MPHLYRGIAKPRKYMYNQPEVIRVENSTVTLLHNGAQTAIKSEKNTVLLSVLQQAGVGGAAHSPCGGKGTCGKCKIRIVSGECDEPTVRELQFLSAEERAAGIRLACYAHALGDVTVALSDEAAQILTTLSGGNAVAPIASRRFVTLVPPSLEDQRDDWTRLKDALTMPDAACTPAFLAKLPIALRAAEYAVTVTLAGRRVIDVMPGEVAAPLYGLAVDIGTTTVVMALVNLQTGAVADTESGLNRQASFGGDVISRIQHAMEDDGGADALRKAIVGQLNALAAALCARNGLQTADIPAITIVGNTVMAHLFLGLPTAEIARAPFIPVCNNTIQAPAYALGLSLHPEAAALVAASVSAYVGGDITAGILASGMANDDALALFIDIGTNGEIALGNQNSIVSCSTAAGPAFEGGHIRCGTGGVAGAINAVRIEDGKPVFTTIGGKPPIGLCGSGVLDIAAALLDEGILDETGYLESDDEEDDIAVFRLTEKVYFSAKDAREIQLAKAAVRAGIDTLLHELHTTEADVQVVYLAGGFGNYMDKNSAVRVGLIPAVLRDRIVPLGNAAGSGAIRLLLDMAAEDALADITAKTTYFELSANAFFQGAYVEQMMFPEE